MAMSPFTADQIDIAADTLHETAIALRAVAAEMREKEFAQLVLQADTAFNIYCGKLHKLAMDAKAELRDQFMAAKMGTVPRWKINQKFNEARDAAKADRIAKGIEPKRTTKKAAQKKGTKRSRGQPG